MNKREQLLQALRDLDNRQRNCNHTFDDAKYDPEIKREEYYTGGYRTQGVHIEYNTAYRSVSIPRWSRVCKHCGFVQYTYDTVVTETKPVFK